MKKENALLRKYWEATQANPISANSASLFINLLELLRNEKTVVRTDRVLTSSIGISEVALKNAQDELRERSILQFRTTPNEKKERDWFREYTMDEDLFDEYDERVEIKLSAEELEKHQKESKKLQSNIQLVYDAYPAKCPNRETSTGKSAKDKKRIEKLLDKKDVDELLKITKQYVRQCIDRGQYMKNFSTFLNNLPELLVEKPITSRIGEEVDIEVGLMSASEKLDWFNDLRKRR